MSDVSFTADQVLSWESGISANGLPTSELKLLQGLWASTDDIQILTELEVTLDASQLGGTTLFTKLTDPAALAALKAQAKGLITDM